MSNPTGTPVSAKNPTAAQAAADGRTRSRGRAVAAPPRPQPQQQPAEPFRGIASWQAKPEMRRRELVCRIEELAGGIPDDAAHMLRRNLDDVDRLLIGSGSYSGRGPERAQGPREWFTGARIEAVWQTLHGVDRALVMYRSRQDLEGSLDGIIAEAEQYLPKDNRLLVQAVGWSRTPPKDLDQLRGGMRDLLGQSHEASDAFYEAARRLRNGMLGITAWTVAAIVALVVLQSMVSTIALVPAPDGFTGAPWVLLSFVMLAGALGAFVTAVPTTIRARSGGLPYRLPIQQRLLKLAIGPLLAVVGVMLVAGGLVATMKTGGLAQLLALAVVFGSAQQAITTFADKSAGALLESKDAT
ncbi:hypothetical protein ACPPVS_05350 [Cellulomonas sp. McL0617]|uniref:hypothetical protein n=1 Tax=Cellulomonas sp. McL0617 TaxID=3415675 RepID=UPI003CF927D9